MTVWLSVHCRYLRIFLIKDRTPLSCVKDATFMLLLMGMWRRGLVKDARAARAAAEAANPGTAKQGRKRKGGAEQQGSPWRTSFLTQETATDIVIACMVVILAVKAFREQCAHIQFCPWR